jgi:hypothetical protein
MSRWVKKNNMESWWIEYVEGELNPKDKELADSLLANSAVDQMIVENLNKLKSQMKDIDSRWMESQSIDWAALEEKIFLKIKPNLGAPVVPQKKLNDTTTELETLTY